MANQEKVKNDFINAMLDEYNDNMALYEMLNDEIYKEKANAAIKILKAEFVPKQKIVVYNAKVID